MHIKTRLVAGKVQHGTCVTKECSLFSFYFILINNTKFSPVNKLRKGFKMTQLSETVPHLNIKDVHTSALPKNLKNGRTVYNLKTETYLRDRAL
jgi:hypothetical protein